MIWAWLIGCGVPAPPPQGPPVVVVLADCLRADRVNAQIMPELTAFSQSAVRAERALSPAAWTVPAVSSLLTGLPPNAHRVLAHAPVEGAGMHRLSENLVTLPEVFAAHGYSTGALLKTDWLAPEQGFAQGYSEYQRVPGEGAGGRSAEELTDAALRWIEDQKGPYFLYLHYMDAHSPYLAPVSPPPDPSSDLTGAHGDVVALRTRAPRPGDQPRLAALYDAEVHYLDQELGRLLRALPPEAVVLVLGDHGEQLLEHGGVLHEDLWEENVRVPWILRDPSLAPARLSGVVSTGTSAATLVDRMGWPVPESWDYPSLLGDIRAGQRSGTAVFSQYADRSALWLGDEKLISGPRGALLYDLRADPGERAPLNIDPRIPGLETRLQAEVERTRRLGVALQGDLSGAWGEDQRCALCALGYLSCVDMECP